MARIVVPCCSLALLLSLCAGPTGAQEKQPAGAVAIQERLATPLKFNGFDDAKMTLGDGLQFLSQRCDVRIVVNEKAFRDRPDLLKTEIIGNRPIEPTTAPLGQMLQTLLTRADSEDSEVAYVIRRDRVEVTTRSALAAEFFPNRHLDLPPVPLVIVSLKKVPLESALEKLARTHDVNIVLDGRAGEAARMPVSAELVNVPLDTAVRLLADMAGLKAVQIDNVVYVTTPANAAVLQKEEERRLLGPFGFGGFSVPVNPGMEK
jgi:hypothetical protein